MGTIIGLMIDTLPWIIAGSWALYGWPRSVQRKINADELTVREVEAKLRRFPPALGYVFLLIAIGEILLKLNGSGFFHGREYVSAILFLAISIGLFALWWYHRPRNNV